MMWGNTVAEEWITVAEAARRLSVSQKTIRRWINDGSVMGRRFGKRMVRVRVESLELLGRDVHKYVTRYDAD